MTDIKANAAEAFLKKLPKDINAILFYGSDSGMVSDRSRALAQKLATADAKNPGDILRMGDADLADDPDRLSVELRTVSMFGGKKILRLQVETRLRPELFADLLAANAPPLEGFLIVEAGDLKGDSKVRSLFAAGEHTAAVACGGDDAEALAGMVDGTLAAGRCTITPPARELLLSLLGADRALSRAELEKLVLYAGPGTEISEAEIAAVVGDAADMAVDDVVMAAFTGRAALALRQADRAMAAGEAPQSIMLAVQRHMLRLHAVRGAQEQGKNLDMAFKGLKPPLFGKARDALTAQCRSWSMPAADRALLMVHDTIAASRQTASPDRELCERLLLDIARLAAASARR